MATNEGFEPDAANQSRGAKANRNGPSAPNESTSFSTNLDTYFSDEKIPIPDRVCHLLVTHLTSV